MYDSSDRRETRRTRCNAMTREEQLLHQELAQLGRLDLAAAVADGRKYHRLDDLLGGWPPEFEGAVGLRLAFDPNAPVPSSKEDWIATALVKYADDQDLHRIVKEWPAYREEKAEAVAKVERIKEKARAEIRAKAKAAAEAAKAEIGERENREAAEAANGTTAGTNSRAAGNDSGTTDDHPLVVAPKASNDHQGVETPDGSPGTTCDADAQQLYSVKSMSEKARSSVARIG